MVILNIIDGEEMTKKELEQEIENSIITDKLKELNDKYCTLTDEEKLESLKDVIFNIDKFTVEHQKRIREQKLRNLLDN